MAGRRGWATWGAGGLAAWLAAGALLARPALATPGIGTVFVGRYPFLRGGQLDSCATCHMPIERDCLNAYGLALRAAGLDFGRVEPLDSDGDGLSNLQEIRRQRPPGSQAAYPEYFIFHTAFSEGDPELGLVHFNHEMHSVKASFFGSRPVRHVPRRRVVSQAV